MERERKDSIDSIDKELDWLIQKDEEEALNAEKQARENGLDQNTDRKEDNFRPEYPETPDEQGPVNGRESPEFAHEPDRNGGGGLDEDLDLTEDQRQAMMELGSMKLDLGIPEDDPPEYDVADRVRQLNEDLAKEPTPSSDERRTSIKFKETLVDLVAPPYDYSDNEDEDSKENGNTNTNSQGENMGGNRYPKSDGEKILVEHGGKFELINSSDLTAEEKHLYGIEDSTDGVNTAGSNDSERSGMLKQPRPPDIQRPATANGTTSRQHLNTTVPRRRPQTAQPRGNNEMSFNFSYVSPYGLSPEQKKCLQRQKQSQEKSLSEKTRMEREQNESKQQENESAFQAWLSHKREQERQEQISTKKSAPSSDNGDPKQNKSFEEWWKAKRQQRRQSLQLDKQHKKEFNEGWYVRSRDDCQHAFKQWLKKKNADLAKTKSEERQSMRMHRLLNRRSHKSQALLKSVTQAQSFRYVDYYGYRF